MDEQTTTPQPQNPNPAPVSDPQPSTAATVPGATTAPTNPISTPAQVDQPQTATDSNASAMKKILLVEDDQGLASVYTTRLKAEGFEVKHVPNGEDALASATSYKPDLVLLDVMMPKVSGFDVLDILRNTPETVNLKIIMLTALGQDADKERAKSLGVDDYLVKSQVVIADVIERIKQRLASN